MKTTDKTPGYNRRLQIAFSYDKNGKKVAYYLSRAACSFRHIRMSTANALLFIALGQADEVPYIKTGRAS